MARTNKASRLVHDSASASLGGAAVEAAAELEADMLAVSMQMSRHTRVHTPKCDVMELHKAVATLWRAAIGDSAAMRQVPPTSFSARGTTSTTAICAERFSRSEAVNYGHSRLW